MKIVIIGGGFAGINLAKKLSNETGFEITLVDKNNYHFFSPLIYQVATCFLEASSISYPFRMFLRKTKNFHFRLGTLVKVFPNQYKVLLTSGELEYDCLIFACGTVTNFFDMKNVQANAIPMKTLDDALDMRNKLLQRIEQASITTDRAEKTKLLTIVVAGGGPTGVEISGMFAEMKNSIIQKDYPELEDINAEIYLVDGGKALLSPMSPKSQQDTYKALTKMGVKVKLNCHVTDYQNDWVMFSDGESIASSNLIWAAGVTGQKIEGIPQEAYGRGNRLWVDAYNQLIGSPDIYAIGDACLQTSDYSFPNGHPQVAQVAIQQGKNLGHNFINLIEQKSLIPFTYIDKGSMAMIGKSKAVVDLSRPRLHLKGFIAWIIWLVIHLFSLTHRRNRAKTLFNWAIAFFTKDQSLRMIIRPKND
ncbi:NAD(P)/FAD-dependent oxidoreductase [Dyadobacter sp. 3J3]|uniref:NAD(P)/FAD-dependent oxidoreductase n=1 Tax=Dyadobacter sp. 3J3 TaxID=2606600 RepID=UPI00135B973D|nr:NAD(P)/FAD-dependent oxidoreductase [Dyadobacter sp. 3J3]